MALTVEEKKLILSQRISQYEREAYMNEINLKVFEATNADSQQKEFASKEMNKAITAVALLNEELNKLNV